MPDHDRPPALLSELFNHQLITAVRHTLSRLATVAGLTGQRRDDFVLAVNELMTNAVRHAGGSGILTLWCQDNALRCEVVDNGPGIPPELIADDPLPPPPVTALGGRGLWLARRLCDSMTIRTGSHGTTVVVAIALPR
jgi:anti-sigma regulatory factor (Ser/Thr protein kinase)